MDKGKQMVRKRDSIIKRGKGGESWMAVRREGNER
jgi:hypothetical protein